MTGGAADRAARRGRVVIGVGNPFRRDDGAGPAVVEALRGRIAATPAVTDGEPARLIELWAGAALAVVVDAVRADPPRPGRVHEQALEAVGRDGLDPPASSHALGLEHAVELGTALDRMPVRLRVYAIEGADFDFGVGLTPEVEAAVATVAARVEALLRDPADAPPAR